jgi:hypothetical protein
MFMPTVSDCGRVRAMRSCRDSHPFRVPGPILFNAKSRGFERAEQSIMKSSVPASIDCRVCILTPLRAAKQLYTR